MVVAVADHHGWEREEAPGAAGHRADVPAWQGGGRHKLAARKEQPHGLYPPLTLTMVVLAVFGMVNNVVR